MARGRQALTERRIAIEALQMIDRDGSFTVDALAKRLGVRGPSLYAHVAGKVAIVEAVRRLVVSEIHYAPFVIEPWDVALRTWAVSYLDAFAAHPNTIHLLATTPVRSEALITQYDAAAGSLLRAGWPASRVLQVITQVESFVLGSALDVAAPTSMVEPTARSNHPALDRVLNAQHGEPQRARETFLVGLDALIGGLRLQLESIQGAVAVV